MIIMLSMKLRTIIFMFRTFILYSEHTQNKEVYLKKKTLNITFSTVVYIQKKTCLFQ